MAQITHSRALTSAHATVPNAAHSGGTVRGYPEAFRRRERGYQTGQRMFMHRLASANIRVCRWLHVLPPVQRSWLRRGPIRASYLI
jgi:hypothetical protein